MSVCVDVTCCLNTVEDERRLKTEGVKMKVRENFERMEEVVKFIAG